MTALSASAALAAERAWSKTGAPPAVPDPTHNPGVLLTPPTAPSTVSVLAASLARGDVLEDGSTVTLAAAVINGDAVFEVDWSTTRTMPADLGVIVTRRSTR